MLSLPPPGPTMGGDYLLAAAASWLVYLWYLPGLALPKNSTMERTDDYTIIPIPTSQLRQPRLLVCLWTSILQRSSTLLPLPPNEYEEIAYMGPTAGRWILRLLNGLYAGIIPLFHTIYAGAVPASQATPTPKSPPKPPTAGQYFRGGGRKGRARPTQHQSALKAKSSRTLADFFQAQLRPHQ